MAFLRLRPDDGRVGDGLSRVVWTSHGRHAADRVFWAAVGAYMAVVVGIGLWSYRRASHEEGFLVAGRSLGPIIGGATLMANQVSAGATIGIVGFHYYSGFSYAWTLAAHLDRLGGLRLLRRAEDSRHRRLHAAGLLRCALRQPCRARDRGSLHPRRVLGHAVGAVSGRRSAVHARERPGLLEGRHARRRDHHGLHGAGRHVQQRVRRNAEGRAAARRIHPRRAVPAGSVSAACMGLASRSTRSIRG